MPEKGDGTDTSQIVLSSSFLTLGHRPGPAVCLEPLLPLWDSGRAARG